MPGAMFPRNRLDALADAIFGVAMTLLVLDIRLPESADPKSGAELIALLASLAPKFGPYALSFVVLGVRWRGLVQGRPSHGDVRIAYVNLMLVYLLLVTLVPFTDDPDRAVRLPATDAVAVFGEPRGSCLAGAGA